MNLNCVVFIGIIYENLADNKVSALIAEVGSCNESNFLATPNSPPLRLSEGEPNALSDLSCTNKCFLPL